MLFDLLFYPRDSSTTHNGESNGEENGTEMETRVVKGLSIYIYIYILGLIFIYKNLGIQIIPTLDPKVYRYYLHWAIWIPRVRRVKRFGFGGLRIVDLVRCAGSIQSLIETGWIVRSLRDEEVYNAESCYGWASIVEYPALAELWFCRYAPGPRSETEKLCEAWKVFWAKSLCYSGMRMTRSGTKE